MTVKNYLAIHNNIAVAAAQAAVKHGLDQPVSLLLETASGGITVTVTSDPIQAAETATEVPTEGAAGIPQFPTLEAFIDSLAGNHASEAPNENPDTISAEDIQEGNQYLFEEIVNRNSNEDFREILGYAKALSFHQNGVRWDFLSLDVQVDHLLQAEVAVSLI